MRLTLHPPDRARRTPRCAALLVIALLPACCIRGPAALFQTTHWAVVGTAAGAAGYDSNLTLSQGGDGAAFVTFLPELVLKRLLSSTTLTVSGKAAFTQYSGPDRQLQTEPAVDITYAYPNWEDRLPRFTGELSWNRSTRGNPSVGDRITTAYTHAEFGGRLLSTGKIGIAAGAAYDATSYQNRQFVDNQRGTFTVGLIYELNPLADFSVNLVSGYGDTAASPTGPGRVRNWEEGLTARVRGQLSPKVTGSLYAGAAVVRYTGAFRRTKTLPLGGGELGWEVTPRGWIYGGLEFGADYSPAGESTETQRVTLRYQQTILGIWRAEVGVSPGRVQYARTQRIREDRTFGAGLALTYEPSPRFSAMIGYDFTNQTSDAAFANFDRHLLTFRLTYHL